MNALITGASNGIGRELAYLFAQDGHTVILVARDQKGLDTVAADLEKKYGIKAFTIAIDLSVPNSAEVVHAKVVDLGLDIDYLVNNAGFGDFGFFTDMEWKNESAMINLNILTLTHFCKIFIPGMVSKKKGKILNVASVAAFVPGPFMAVYFATKAYVFSFSQALNSELSEKGITVTALCPGPTRTNFAKTAHADKTQLFEKNLSSAADVAYAGYRALIIGKSIVVPGFRNKLLVFSTRFVPRKILVTISRKASGK